MVHGRGNANNAMLDQLWQITTKLDAIETTKRRGAHFDDLSDDVLAAPNHNLELEEDQDEEILLRVLSRENSKLAIEVVPYDGKLDTNALLD